MGPVMKGKELIITTPDKAGMLAEVTSVISSAGVNIQALCAYSMEGVAIFMLVTSDNQQTQSIAEAKGWQVQEDDVLIVELSDKVGAAQEIAEKLKADNLNLQYCYATTCSCTIDCDTNFIIKADDCDAAFEALK